MGLLKHLLFWPVTGPKFLIDFSMGKVDEVVKEELTDDARIKSELMELQLQLELGDIDDDEYVRREADLMAQLREIREWREHFGMGVSGGPVRVQPQPERAAPAGTTSGIEAERDASEAAAEGSPAGATHADGTSDSAEASASAEVSDERAPRVARPGDATIEFNLGWDE
jgi:Gas vesicle protein G